MTAPRTTPLRILSAAHVDRALPMPDAIQAMKDAFRELSVGSTCVPPRTHVPLPEHNADVLFMPAYSPATASIGLKIVTLHPENRRQGLPFIQALVVTLDAKTGTPLAVINGTLLTAIRTGAASGAATDLLARPDASVVALFGAGVQAQTQLAAVCAVRPIVEARVCDVDAAAAERFAETMRQRLDIDVRPCRSSAEALAGAHVVCTATNASGPVFDDRELADGAHINAIGAYKPHVREIPAQTVARARVVVDQVDAAWEEAGDLIMARNEGAIDASHIHAELGQIVAGQKTGRQSPDEITLFKSVGIAIQDLAAARCVMQRAAELSLGATVNL